MNSKRVEKNLNSKKEKDYTLEELKEMGCMRNLSDEDVLRLQKKFEAEILNNGGIRRGNVIVIPDSELDVDFSCNGCKKLQKELDELKIVLKKNFSNQKKA